MSNTLRSAWPVRGGRAVLTLLALAVVVGCAAQSELTDLWHDSSQPPGSLHDILVVGIRKDPVRRRLWEDAFVGALTARGVTSTASYRLFPGAPPDTQQVIEALRTHPYDAVLVSTRLPDEATSHYVPGAYRNQPVTRPDDFGRLHSYWISVQDPGYTETNTVILVQTDVWAVNRGGGHLVWSGTLRTLETMETGTVEGVVAKRIMPALDQQGVFPTIAH